jgi:4-hydroxy-tetrahydrodipicolinate synthase
MGKFAADSIRGIVPPIATPINSDETVDEKGMRRLVNFLLDQGVHGLFVMGGTGEFFCFPDREKAKAIEIVVDEAAGRAPVIAGISDLSTRRAIDNAHMAQEKGVDFIASLPPFFFNLSQDWICSFYTAIAAEIDVPLMLYNILNPINTNILPETIDKLSRHPRIVGIKDSEEFTHVEEVLFSTHEQEFRVLIGLESLFYAGVNLGAAGGVLSAANFCPRLCVEIYEKTVAGEQEQAIVLQKKLNRLLGELGRGRFPSWWGVVKASLSILGICEGAVTRPMPACTDDDQSRLKGIMDNYGLI